jgi:hypothetical protein
VHRKAAPRSKLSRSDLVLWHSTGVPALTKYVR